MWYKCIVEDGFFINEFGKTCSLKTSKTKVDGYKEFLNKEEAIAHFGIRINLYLKNCVLNEITKDFYFFTDSDGNPLVTEEGKYIQQQ